MVVVSVIKVLWSILDRRGRITFNFLVSLLFMAGLFEMGGMIAIFGFISGLRTSDALGHRSGQVGELVEWLVGGPADQLTYVMIAGSAVLAFMITKNVQGTAAQFYMNRFLMKRNLVLSKELLEGYLSAPYERLQPRALDAIQKRIVEIYSVFSNNFTSAAQVLADGLTLAMVVGLLLYINPALTLISALMFGGVGSLIYWGLQKTLKSMGRLEHEAKSNANKYLEHAFGGIIETRLRDLRTSFVHHYTRALSQTSVIRRRKLALDRLPRSTNEILLTAMIVGSVLYLSLTGKDVADALPVLGVFGFAGLRMTGAMSRLNNNLQRLRQGHHRMNQLAKTLETVTTSFGEAATNIGNYTQQERQLPPGTSAKLTASLKIEDIRFRFPGMKTDIIRGISLEVRRGSFIAFCGPSGGGKSTLIKLLMGLLVPTRGTIFCDGWNIFHHIRDWHRNIGYVGQYIFLTDESVRLNVAFGVPEKQIDDERVKRALRLARALDFVEAMDQGLDTPLRSGDILSGGQKQRIVIARALYHDPEILIFDEATAALDNETEREITHAIKQLSGEKTVICVAHRLSTIRACDTIHYVDKGQVKASGDYEQLLDECAPFRAMVEAGELSNQARRRSFVDRKSK